MKTLSALFPLLIFLFIHVTEARNNRQICSSSCGDIPNISYPFRLKEDPAGCGDPDFELSCRNNTTILNFHGGLYYVKRISYDERIIRVVDVNLSNGTCGLPYRALSMDEVLEDDRYPGVANYSMVYNLNYVRCSNNISNLADSRVPCLSGNSNSSHVYVNITSFVHWYSNEIPKSCEIISTLPATYEDRVQLINPPYETVLKMQETGFDMVWSVECRDCRAKGRGCAWQFNTTTRFQCEKEDDYYDDGLRGAYTLLAGVVLGGLIGFFRFLLLPLVIFAFILHKCFSSRK